jgi:hypothetical protein
VRSTPAITTTTTRTASPPSNFSVKTQTAITSTPSETIKTTRKITTKHTYTPIGKKPLLMGPSWRDWRMPLTIKRPLATAPP